MQHPLLKKFELSVWLDDWIEDPQVIFRGMFGGLTVYYQGRQVLFLVEDPVTRVYKDKDFGTAIWDGFLFPTSREHHASMISEFKCLVPHPVLPKWLYLPKSSPEFEDAVPLLLDRVFRGDTRFGIDPGQRKAKTAKRTKKKTTKTRPKTKLKLKKQKLRSDVRKKVL